MKIVKGTLLAAVREAVRLIGKSPFWLVALADLCLRLFVVRPLGALLALAVGCIWVTRNTGKIRRALAKLRRRCSSWADACEKKSPWFEKQGRTEIIELVDWLSAQDVSFCNLADEMELPEKTQWQAISRGLNEADILTQITGDNFYITWRVPRNVKNTPETA